MRRSHLHMSNQRWLSRSMAGLSPRQSVRVAQRIPAMATYNDIKAEAIRLHNDKTTCEGTRKMAEVAVALCDRLAELEERQRLDVQRLENWFRNMRR